MKVLAVWLRKKMPFLPVDVSEIQPNALDVQYVQYPVGSKGQKLLTLPSQVFDYF